MRPVIPICALLLFCPPAMISAETSANILSLPEVQPWSGDFDGMLKRRVIRILVDTLGLIAETGQEFEKWINKRHAKGPYDIKVDFVPTRRDRIFQELIDGKGDIAAANMTITSRRSELGIDDIVTRAEDNIHSGAKYLRYLVDKYLNDPNLGDEEKVLMMLAAYNAGPGNLQRFREKARQLGFDANIWFGNVEHGAAAIVGQETVQYIGNIHKYFIVYSTLLPTQNEATGTIKSEK